MTDIYLNRDNAITHQLQFKRVGSNKVRNYDLTDAEVQIQFYNNKKLLVTLSSVNHTNVKIVDAANGTVSYQPEESDFTGINIKSVNYVGWVVVNGLNPNGLIFRQPTLPIRVFAE